MQGNGVFSRSALRAALLTFGGSAPALAAPSSIRAHGGRGPDDFEPTAHPAGGRGTGAFRGSFCEPGLEDWKIP